MCISAIYGQADFEKLGSVLQKACGAQDACADNYRNMAEKQDTVHGSMESHLHAVQQRPYIVRYGIDIIAVEGTQSDGQTDKSTQANMANSMKQMIEVPRIPRPVMVPEIAEL